MAQIVPLASTGCLSRSKTPLSASPHVHFKSTQAPKFTTHSSPTPFIRPSKHNASQGWRVRSSSGLEEVDPMTGEIIAGTTLTVIPASTIEAGGLKWAYREAPVNESKATPDKMPVLCLHGIGSSSYAYRTTIRLLGNAGYRAIALDLPGHGSSDKPESGFDYSAEAYLEALPKAVAALGLNQPFNLIVHGYILGQFGMLYALENSELIAKLIILNTPLSLKSKLRPELAAYKNPMAFLRPKPDVQFNGAYFNAAGGPYAMAQRDADAYNAPYAESPAASSAIYRTMDAVDFPALLRRVDEGYQTWRRPSLVVHGNADAFLDLKGPLDWLDTKRTTMKIATAMEAKLGHCPQEDYPEALHPILERFLQDS